MKAFWDITESEAQKCLDKTRWPQADREYFRGGGYSSQFTTEGEMPVTMSRVNMANHMVCSTHKRCIQTSSLGRFWHR